MGTIGTCDADAMCIWFSDFISNTISSAVTYFIKASSFNRFYHLGKVAGEFLLGP